MPTEVWFLTDLIEMYLCKHFISIYLLCFETKQISSVYDVNVNASNQAISVITIIQNRGRQDELHCTAVKSRRKFIKHPKT